MHIHISICTRVCVCYHFIRVLLFATYIYVYISPHIRVCIHIRVHMVRP